MNQELKATVIGAGLAGSEAAWQLAQRGIAVTLYEMKPKKMTPAHKSEGFAELICSNSLRANNIENAVGLLKEEMRRCGSLIMEMADKHAVPAGGALAVDRYAFSQAVTEAIKNHPNITVVEEEVTAIPEEGQVLIASGPLTSDELAQHIAGRFPQQNYLHFFDAVAPLVNFESVDMEKAWFGSRYGKGTADYINCPMTREEYDAFWTELCGAEEAKLHGFEDQKVFEGCMPVEVMGRRGHDTLCYGPLKPVGLPDPRTGQEPYAVVQLRKDNAEGSIYNIVGFQTHLTWLEQRRVFRMIPGLENADFVRYGVMHRNTYIDSPRLLNHYYQVIDEPRLSFAGQMTGVEGYVESAASGLLAGSELARRMLGQEPLDFPRETALGALSYYISNPTVTDFQPMNVNFGIIPPLGRKIRGGKKVKNAALAERALNALEEVLQKSRNN
ncbi:MAG: methylenetetrahydrofolate--tRNA-(uracil(54)-C(5))-methyltransferase (FADH(2)-oxidizing) TrmFO [Oscillospiraceae bacterium]|nr:methylenetetrahydrofolate--tRNA-(uracil(54)-C(5))-methyltransferase (FADH(2)-oxidizing) TrmFO [Oscillospiraceae bacterium]